MPRNILVVGSVNTDLVVAAPRLPAKGETVLGGDFRKFAGGKGANQAVAAARAGGEVAFLGAIGNDDFGAEAAAHLAQERIDITRLKTIPDIPSGVALILVDQHGENMIAVAPGANHSLTPEDIDAVDFSPFEYVVLQLEIRHETAGCAIRRAAQAGCRVILNPGPAAPVPAPLLPLIDTLVPNRTELGQIAGTEIHTHDDIRRASRALIEKGLKRIVTTLGADGALWGADGKNAHVPAPQVHAVDTVGAGDCFIGALTVAFTKGYDTAAAIAFATRAAALSVQRPGAQASFPTLAEIRSSLGAP